MEECSPQQYFARETFSGYNRLLQRGSQVNGSMVNNLELECTLEGHTGCVNCLDWNEDGTILASGSDDTKIFLWDPFQKKCIHHVDTLHHANIFSVKFLPQSGDRVIASGAADGSIFLNDLVEKTIITSYHVEGRIKRIAIAKDEPHMIITASEDGIVREYDTRQQSESVKTLVNLSESSPRLECKCVTISPTESNLFAVGANDPYVRLYDRRMTDMQKYVTVFVPGHLHSSSYATKRKLRNYCVTYLVFNFKGNELLVNLGGEQIYIFDVRNRTTPFSSSTSSLKNVGLSDRSTVPNTSKTLNHTDDNSDFLSVVTNSFCLNTGSSDSTYKWKASRCNEYRLKGNGFFCDKKYSAAIAMYNKALLFSTHSVIYSNRAAAFLKRHWDGDYYAALRDCYKAISINPADVKARFRLARCMFELKWFDEALNCLKEFQQRHPEHSSNSACVALEKDICSAMNFEECNKTCGSQYNDCVMNSIWPPKMPVFDFSYRYCGHCNTTTDIKEASYFGEEGKYVVAGSDEGSFFIWEHETTNLVRVMRGDSSIVNCLQSHPSICMLATSGIDSNVKLWSPKMGDVKLAHVIEDMDEAAAENQKLMNNDQLDSMLISMSMRFGAADDDNQVAPCRTS